MWRLFLDSVIFIENDGQEILRTGSCLGDLTDEIAEYGEPDKPAEIVEFVAAAPKLYALRIKRPNGEIIEQSKMKGITINFQNKESTSFQAIKRLVDENAITPVNCGHSIFKNKQFQVFTVQNAIKKLGMSYNKRARVGMYDTKPWGFCEMAEEQPQQICRIEAWESKCYKK
jgi:hypothetical protein